MLTVGALALFLLTLATGLTAAEERESGTVVRVDAPEFDTGLVLPDGASEPIDFEDPNFLATGLGQDDCVTFLVSTGGEAGTFAFDLQPCGEEEEGEELTICHIPPGNPGNAHTVTISESEVSVHLAHGDSEEVEGCGPPGGKQGSGKKR